MNRRSFLKILGVAPLTIAVPAFAKLKLLETDEERFIRLLKTGDVVGEKFVFHTPITIQSANNFRITGCRFLWKGEGDMITFNHADNGKINSCRFWSEKTFSGNYLVLKDFNNLS